MTEEADGSRRTDRVRATCWLGAKNVRIAIENLKFSHGCLQSIAGTPGSNERRMFDLAHKGFRHDVNYILDSLDRLLEGKP